ncbi:unnamed protein product [Lactuca virosa]|uniref:Plant heme peroxidase family profile domain-containing protein n=1 Tax=Lactuca virosa TaxID=75947 RepID=A0AAU9PFV1_9ASTR|nr:unnamed protein product [Lactuca virosa]
MSRQLQIPPRWPISKTHFPNCDPSNQPRLQETVSESLVLGELLGWLDDLCGGVMGKYAGGELKPPFVAVVPALLLPPPTTSMDEHFVAGLIALEPYSRLFHRYYAIGSPSATQRLLLGLLEAPPSWAPDAFDAVVQLVELLRAAEDYASGMRILSQPALLFPPLTQTEGVELQDEHLNCYNSNPKKFKNIAIDTPGVVALLGSHNVGRTHCVKFVHRLYPEVDPVLDPGHVEHMLHKCPDGIPDPKAV